MSSCSSPTVVYRTLQALHDLRRIAARAPHATVARIASRGEGPDPTGALRRLIREMGCRLDAGSAAQIHGALVLAATFPDEDFDVFRCATAILLSDRLMHGAGQDDLFWHWDAFREHYALLPPPDRAAIMNGFRCAQVQGLIALFDPPEGSLLTTEHRSVVAARLAELARQPDAAEIAGVVLAALEPEGDLADTVAVWEAAARDPFDPGNPVHRILLRGLRHVYEAREGWAPYPGRRFDPLADGPPLLPVL